MPTILACGDPFRNVGPMGWLVIYAFLAGLAVSCILAVVNPLLAATLKADWRRKRFHLGLAAAYVLPGLVFALLVATGGDIGGDSLLWFLLIYFWVLPLWTLLHFGVLLCTRRNLRRAAQNSSSLAT